MLNTPMGEGGTRGQAGRATTYDDAVNHARHFSVLQPEVVSLILGAGRESAKIKFQLTRARS